MLLWLVFGYRGNWGPPDQRGRWVAGGDILFFILLLLLGWKLFGAPLKGG